MIYENISFQDYLKLDGMNASTLKPYLTSQRYGYYKSNKEFERTHAMSMGTLVHALILEGQDAANKLLSEQYIISGYPINDKTGSPYGQGTKKYTDWINGLPESEKYKEVLFPVELNQVNKITRAITEHKESREILGLAENREFAVTWTCQHTGILCKALIDFQGDGYAGDLKTFGKALDYSSIRKEISNRQYHLQFSFYFDGLLQNGFNVDDFYVIFAGTSEDYDVGCFRVNDETMEQGQLDYIQAIYNYQDANKDSSEFKKGRYPNIINIGIPDYLIKEDTEEQEIINQILEGETLCEI